MTRIPICTADLTHQGGLYPSIGHIRRGDFKTYYCDKCYDLLRDEEQERIVFLPNSGYVHDHTYGRGFDIAVGIALVISGIIALVVYLLTTSSSQWIEP